VPPKTKQNTQNIWIKQYIFISKSAYSIQYMFNKWTFKKYLLLLKSESKSVFTKC
jgi:hypothetical protein